MHNAESGLSKEGIQAYECGLGPLLFLPGCYAHAHSFSVSAGGTIDSARGF